MVEEATADACADRAAGVPLQLFHLRALERPLGGLVEASWRPFEGPEHRAISRSGHSCTFESRRSAHVHSFHFSNEFLDALGKFRDLGSF